MRARYLAALLPVIMAAILLIPRPWPRGVRREIRIDGTMVPSSQTDFPVLMPAIDKQALNSFYAWDRWGYWKIKQLDWPSDGAVWLRIPNLHFGSDTVIYWFYDKEIAWDANFRTVWHFKGGE